MERKRIGLVVVSRIRDLPGMTLVGRELARRGAEVFLIPKNHLRRESLLLAPHFLLTSNLRRPNDSLHKLFHSCGIQFGVLDNEGGVMPSPEWFRSKLTRDADVRSSVSLFCSWGEKVAEPAREQAWFPNARITTTGCPRLDFQAAPWLPVAAAADAGLDDLPKPLILINTRFSIANPDTAPPALHAKSLAGVMNLPIETVRGWQAILDKSLTDMAELANRLATEFPGASIVLRPHPFERLETYQPLLKPLPNLHLIREGTIDGWIQRAAAVVHRCCSTAIDAGMAGVPAFSARWIKMHEEIESVERASIACDSPEQLIGALKEVASGNFVVPPEVCAALNATIADWFFAIDGRSHLRVADAIWETLEQRSAPDPRTTCEREYRRIMRKIHRSSGTLFSRSAASVSRLLGWPEPEPPDDRTGGETGIRAQGKWKASTWEFGRSEVQHLLDLLQPCDGGRFTAAHPRIGRWPGSPLRSLRILAG